MRGIQLRGRSSKLTELQAAQSVAKLFGVHEISHMPLLRDAADYHPDGEHARSTLTTAAHWNRGTVRQEARQRHEAAFIGDQPRQLSQGLS